MWKYNFDLFKYFFLKHKLSLALARQCVVTQRPAMHIALHNIEFLMLIHCSAQIMQLCPLVPRNGALHFGAPPDHLETLPGYFGPYQTTWGLCQTIWGSCQTFEDSARMFGDASRQFEDASRQFEESSRQFEDFSRLQKISLKKWMCSKFIDGCVA